MSEKLTVVLSDLQLPYQNNRAMNVVYNFLADRKTDIYEIHQIGDFFDFLSVSRWAAGTPDEDGKKLQKEIDTSETVMQLLNSAIEGEPIRLTRIKGNHDDRLNKYLSTKARGLLGLKALEYDTLTLAKEYGWTTEKEPYKLAPDTVAVHGLSVRKWSGHTPHAHLERLPGNVVHGHTHRAGVVYRTLGSKTRWAMEVGCLMDKRQASYLAAGMADWQLGFGLIYDDGQNAWPSFVEIKPNYTTVVDGRKYGQS